MGDWVEEAKSKYAGKNGVDTGKPVITKQTDYGHPGKKIRGGESKANHDLRVETKKGK